MSKKLLHHFESKQKSIEERIDAGKALRHKCKRLSLGTYKTPSKRIDPVALLEKQGKDPFTGPGSHPLCKDADFSFCISQGQCSDHGRRYCRFRKNSGLIVQACGDMHVANFGVFSSAERNLIFGINDFDETLPAPFEWDLKRLVASIVACRTDF